jgi:hypothetical protein
VEDSITVLRTSRSRRRAPDRLLGVLVCAALAAAPGSASSQPLPKEPAARVAPVHEPQRGGTTSGRSEDDRAAASLPLKLELVPGTFKAERGHAWFVTLPPEWAEFSSNVDDLDKSRLRLTEDGVPLGPANATHAEIREEGRGAYSHWLTALYFSTSDNSDPRRNGRAYVVEIPASEE